MRALLPVLPALLVLAGCSAGSSGASSDGDDTVAASGSATQLQVELVPDAGATPRRWTLTCDPAGGDHPDAEAACADLAATDEPFAPLPEDALCTELYGGPQTAGVRGQFRGERVELELSRTDGCRTDQWDRLGALLPDVSAG